MKFTRTAKGVRMARRPSTVGEKRVAAVGMTLASLGLAYVFWARATDSGIVGWFDALQARGSGKFDETLSFFLSMVCVVVPAFAVALPFGRLGRSARQVVPVATPRDALATQSRVVLIVGLAMIVAIWVGGFGTYEYYTLRTQQEMAATYEPVDVAAPVGAASALRFVALHGKVHPLGYLKQTENHNQDGTFFLPLVARSVRDPAVPVHWVLRAEGSTEPMLPATIYAHAVGQTLPQTVREAFERDGTKIAADAMLVSYVMTDSTGQVVDGSGNYFWLFIGGCSVISVLTAMMLAASWFKLRLAHRRLARATPG